MIAYFSADVPDVFIGVDGPDFNFVIEKKLKRQGIKTVHFISPSVWAWRQGRIKKIKKSTDLVLCLFPFEVDFYQKYGQRAVFVAGTSAEKYAIILLRNRNKAGNFLNTSLNPITFTCR
jgi:lipid-A-disaccharide synthase